MIAGRIGVKARERFGFFAAFRPDFVNALEDGGGRQSRGVGPPWPEA
jgi:hypothetical protein